jgi:hypothetical protein
MKCCICHLTVAPYDKEQQKIGNNVAHGSCFKRHLKDKQPLRIVEVKVERR